MAGLLDFLSSDDAQLGINLLAAGGPTTDPNASGFGARLGGAVNATRASQAANDEKALRRLYLQGQIAAQQQAAADAVDKRANMQRYFGLLSGEFTPGGAPASPQAPSVPNAGGAGGGTAPGGSNVAPSETEAKRAAVTGRPVDISQLNPNQVAVLQALAKQAGMPDPVEVWKASKADWQVTDGYRWNKNAQGNQEGFLPGVTIAANGQAVGREGGPDGRARVYLPEGAGNALRTQERIKGEEGARFQEAQPTIDTDPNSPNYGRTVVRTKLDQYGGGAPAGGAGGGPAIGRGPGYSSPGLAGGSTAAAANDTAQVLQSELAKTQQVFATATDPAVKERARQDIIGLQRELQRAGAPAIGAAPPAGAGRGVVNPAIGPAANVTALSPAEQATNEANRTKAVDTAKADVARDTARQAAGKQFQQMQSNATKALELLSKNPTGSGMGAAADAALGFIGQPTESSKTADALEALSGWMVSNVPRMEGPQSNVDVLNYQKMAGRVGDRSLPVENRKEALAVVMDLQNKYAAINGSTGAEAAAPSAGSAPAVPAGWTVKQK